MKVPDVKDYAALIEVDSQWARGTVTQIFGIAHGSTNFAVMSGWVVDDSHPHGLLVKMMLAEDFAKVAKGEQPTPMQMGFCFVPWRFIRYIAYLEDKKLPETVLTKIGFIPVAPHPSTENA